MAKNDTPQTITAYHGQPDDNSMTFYEKWKKSRYGFPAIFFSEGKKVAGEYALAGRRKRGVIWGVKVQPVAVEIDLENIRSYGSKFRNLIYELHDGGYIALLCPKGLGERLHFSRGWNQVRGGWGTSWGGAYLMRRAVAAKVINHDFYQAHLNGTLDGSNLINYAPNKRIDHVIPEVIHQLGLSQYYYAPSLAKHIGYTSTIGHTHRPEDEPFNP